jgi:hypothetical protein
MDRSLSEKAKRAYILLSGACLGCSVIGLAALFVASQPGMYSLYAFSGGAVGAFIFGIPVRTDCHLWPVVEILEWRKRKK